jgi:prolipoprotein diacylglyceryl transferase
MFGAIPSPSSNAIEIGPLDLRAYGLMIALGVFAAVWLAQRRWAAQGHDPEDFIYVAMRAVPAGLIGARLYHVITDWRSFEGRWGDAVKIWEGGLGIPGGMLAGVLVGVWAARRRGMVLPDALDAAAPALPLAQAIGRLGNWFNQELFGKPTDLPWGLEIDLEHRPPGYAANETFHPAFLYEMIWNLGLCGFLIWLDSKRVLRRGYLIAVYVLGYATGRLFIELLRIDKASRLFGVRINVWTSLLAIAAAIVVIGIGIRKGRDPEPEPTLAPEPATDDDHDADDHVVDAAEGEGEDVDEFADLRATEEDESIDFAPEDDESIDFAPDSTSEP